MDSRGAASDWAFSAGKAMVDCRSRHSREGGNPGGTRTLDSRLRGNDGWRIEGSRFFNSLLAVADFARVRLLPVLVCLVVPGVAASDDAESFKQLHSPIVLRGDDTTAYRDPAALYHDGKFYLFTTVVETEPDGLLYWYTAVSTSSDLKTWSEPRKITPKGQDLNFSSPGNVVRFGGEWVLCLQTYPVPGLKRSDPVRWANQDARIWIMRSADLEHWSPAELLTVKGPSVPIEAMGRMIDPYLVQDIRDPRKWWCFYKQKGVSFSWSHDLKTWTYAGRADSGENVCVLHDQGEYLLFHSPHNGIGVKRSGDLVRWRDVGGLITLGQHQWPWAETRLTAGVVLDLRSVPRIGKYLMFFHGSGPGKTKTMDNAFANCSIGIAWSDDLGAWHWPGKTAIPKAN